MPITDAPQATSGYLYRGDGNGTLIKVPFNGTTLGTPTTSNQPNLTAAHAAFVAGNKLYWAKTDTTAPTGSTLNISLLNASGGIGAPWISSGFNSWFDAAAMTGAFYLSGRMYYTTADNPALTYRYLEPDGYVVGCTTFTLPTQGIDWRAVLGMTWVNGKIMYGSTDGSLKSVPFDPTAANGLAADGSTATVIAAPTAGKTWSKPTLYFATS